VVPVPAPTTEQAAAAVAAVHAAVAAAAAPLGTACTPLAAALAAARDAARSTAATTAAAATAASAGATAGATAAAARLQQARPSQLGLSPTSGGRGRVAQKELRRAAGAALRDFTTSLAAGDAAVNAAMATAQQAVTALQQQAANSTSASGSSAAVLQAVAAAAAAFAQEEGARLQSAAAAVLGDYIAAVPVHEQSLQSLGAALLAQRRWRRLDALHTASSTALLSEAQRLAQAPPIALTAAATAAGTAVTGSSSALQQLSAELAAAAAAAQAVLSRSEQVLSAGAVLCSLAEQGVAEDVTAVWAMSAAVVAAHQQVRVVRPCCSMYALVDCSTLSV
jgi:trimeric autotransporter adhesin